jgi:hypothetical protein
MRCHVFKQFNILAPLINFYKQEISYIGTLFQPCDILFTKATSHPLVSTEEKIQKTNNDLQNIHIKLNSGNTNPLKTGGELMCSVVTITTSHPHVSAFNHMIYYL